MLWDGRARSLEAQRCFRVMIQPMAMPSRSKLERLQEDPAYEPRFARAFADGMTVANMALALACSQRTILARNAPYDRYIAGDKDAMSAAAVRGLEVFSGRGSVRAATCRRPSRLFVLQFGVGMDSDDPDLGRYHVFKMESAEGKFRTPTLPTLP